MSELRSTMLRFLHAVLVMIHHEKRFSLTRKKPSMSQASDDAAADVVFWRFLFWLPALFGRWLQNGLLPSCDRRDLEQICGI